MSKKTKDDCVLHNIGESFHESSIIEAAIQWCELVGYDSSDEKIFTAFVMGAKLAISNNGWCDCKLFG